MRLKKKQILIFALLIIATNLLTLAFIAPKVYAVAPTAAWTLLNNLCIQWKDSAGTARCGIWLDASNNLQLGGTGIATVTLGSKIAGTYNIGGLPTLTVDLTFLGARTFSLASETANALKTTDGTNPFISIDTRTTLSTVAGVLIDPNSPTTNMATIASSAGTQGYQMFEVGKYQLTFTGTNTIGSTYGLGASVFAPTVTDSSALTITKASTMYIDGAPVAGGSVTITNPYAFYVNAGASFFGGNMILNTKITNYNNIATVGIGIVPVYAATSQKTETSADTNVLTYTPSSTAGNYRICFTAAVSAQNAATLGWTATWTDSNGVAQTPTNIAAQASGVASPFLTRLVSTNDVLYGCAIVDIDNSGTNIVVKLTFSGTSFTAKVTSTIEQLG